MEGSLRPYRMVPRTRLEPATLAFSAAQGGPGQSSRARDRPSGRDLPPEGPPLSATDPAQLAINWPHGAALLAQIIGGDRRPARHARMTRPGASAKYYTVHAALDDAQLAAHLAGSETYAAPLIGRDGLAGAGVIELDIGAEAAARQALAALAAAGVTAFSIVTPGSGGHNGSHTWALYRARGDPPAIQAQLRQAALSADLPAREIFPTDQCIRLPFGLHRRTRRRGVLLLQDGRRFDLDAGELPAAIQAVAALPRNPLPQPVAQEPSRPRVQPTISSGDVIGDYCRETDLVGLLASYPGYRVVSRSGARAILRCGCPHHQHGDRRPSLEVRPGRDGRQVLLGYAPSCIWHNQRGRNDAFNVFCTLEGLSPRDAVRRLARPVAHTPGPPHPVANDPPRPAPAAADREDRQRDAERKREGRRAEAQGTRRAVEENLERDSEISARGRAVLRALLEVAGARDWCRPSVARLTEMTGYSERTVQYALADLERAGYIASTPVRAGTTYRHFVAPVESSAAAGEDFAPVETSRAGVPPDVATIESSGAASREPAAAFAPIEISAPGAVAPESAQVSESPDKSETCEGRAAAQRALWDGTGAAPRCALPDATPRRRSGLPRRAWAQAATPALEQELQRQRAILRHIRRGPARAAVERAVFTLRELIAARRDIGLAVMRYANDPGSSACDSPRQAIVGPAVAFAGGACFVPQGAGAEALQASLKRRLAAEDSPAPPSQAQSMVAEVASATPSGGLPPGWSVERCDHKGNPTAYGVYWRARGPAGDLEPTLYLDTAWRAAWRAARAESCPP